ncbi:MAG TPA: hypothetical protein VMS17_19975 [Gemmataceae bacterium]|nr:hypothetical protein [Gemmataceae bacterium]
MRSALIRFFDQAVAALRELMDRPWSLFFALLAVNAIALPYKGILHDSQLYAVQVMNRVENGVYADDLFFRYGSQDRFSVFSIAAAPLVQVLGLQNAFFLLYLVFNALLLLAAQRLTMTLFKNRIIAALSLLLLATTPLPYSGGGALVVNENFVTPRILAVALTIFALDQMFKKRYVAVVLLLIGAALMHPLMAFGGALVFGGWWAVERFGWKWTLIVCAGLAAVMAAILIYRPLGTRLLGPMDNEWREYSRRAVPMNFPSEWILFDWINLGAGLVFAFAVGLVPCREEDRRIARFGLVLGVVSAVTVVGTFVAAWLPYALPLQGQPYRALWLLRLMQAPFGLQLAWNLWRLHGGALKLVVPPDANPAGAAPTPELSANPAPVDAIVTQAGRGPTAPDSVAAAPIASEQRPASPPFWRYVWTEPWQDGVSKLLAALVAGYFCVVFFAPLEFGIMAFAAAGAAVVYFRGLGPTPQSPHWLARSTAAGAIVGALIWIVLRYCDMVKYTSKMLHVVNPTQYVALMLEALGFVGWAAVVLALVWLAVRRLGVGWRFQAAAAGTCLFLQTAALIVLYVWEVPVRPTSDLAFIGEFLEKHPPKDGDSLHTIYCAVGEPADIWLIAHAKSYFTRHQLAGNVFYRETAEEGQRRALVVKRFEQERMRRYVPFIPDELKRSQEELFGVPLDVGPPTLKDLAAVCQEEGVDYVAVPEAFNAPCVASNGRIYIYDCEQVRAALKSRSPKTGARPAPDKPAAQALVSPHVR